MPARTTGRPRRARTPPMSSAIPRRTRQRSTRGRRSPTLHATPATRQGAGAGSRRSIAADAAAGSQRTDRSRYLAAHGALELARPHDDLARAIKLTVPLDQSLLAKKTATEQALAGYSRAAQYGIADVTTAAGWAMADLYRDLGKSLLESERPPSLSAEEREAYDVLLEEQAFPFEEKAIEIHEANARRAADGVYDQWVRKSYTSLAELKPARYARTELDPGPAAPAAPDPEAPAPDSPVPPEIAAQLEVARASLEAGRDEEAVGELECGAEPSTRQAPRDTTASGSRIAGSAGWRRPGPPTNGRSPRTPRCRRRTAISRCCSTSTSRNRAPHSNSTSSTSDSMAVRTRRRVAWLEELRARMKQAQRTADAQP